MVILAGRTGEATLGVIDVTNTSGAVKVTYRLQSVRLLIKMHIVTGLVISP